MASQPLRLAGFTMTIRANATLSKLVKLWRDTSKTVAFDLTGYTQLYSSVKERLTDATPLFEITAQVSTIGLDSAGNEMVVTPADGWVQLYAPPEDTAAAQSLGELSYGKRAWVDLLGIDSEGSRIPLAVNDGASVTASVTEVA